MSTIRRRTFFQAVAAAGVVPITSTTAAPPVPSLPGTTVPAPQETTPELRRGPFLQAQGDDRIVIRWRTDGSAKDSRLRYGDSPEALDRTVPARLVPTSFKDVEDWAAVVEGLEPSRTYYYAVDASTAILAGADEAHSFRTAPPRGRPAPVRFWVLGDCGTNRVNTGNPGK